MKSKLKAVACQENKITMKVINQNPDELIGVKTTRVYSQIARMSRDPQKQTERVFLITVLEESSVKSIVRGRVVKKDPPFITMKAADIKRCFGRQLERLPDSSFFNMSNVSVKPTWV